MSPPSIDSPVDSSDSFILTWLVPLGSYLNKRSSGPGGAETPRARGATRLPRATLNHFTLEGWPRLLNWRRAFFVGNLV